MVTKCFVDRTIDENTCKINDKFKFSESDKLAIFKCIMNNEDTIGSLFITYYSIVKNPENIFKTFLIVPNCIFLFIKSIIMILLKYYVLGRVCIKIELSIAKINPVRENRFLIFLDAD